MQYISVSSQLPEFSKEYANEYRLLLLTECYGEFLGFYDGNVFRTSYATVLENVTHWCHLPSYPERVDSKLQFEQLLTARLEELPYTKHLDDGQYNDGQAYGFECGARWAYETLSSGTAVGKAGAVEVLNIKTGQLITVEGYGFMFGRDFNSGEIRCFNIENVSGESREGAFS